MKTGKAPAAIKRSGNLFMPALIMFRSYISSRTCVIQSRKFGGIDGGTVKERRSKTLDFWWPRLIISNPSVSAEND